MINTRIFLITFLAASLWLGDVSSQTISQRMSANLERLSQDDDLDFYDFQVDDGDRTGEKSKWKALGLSILVPGAGQYYTEATSRMYFFGAAEVLTWSNFVGLRLYGKWKKEDYISWAAKHAGVDVKNKSDSYFETLTYYDNIDIYNQLELLYERSEAELYPDTPEFYWNWDSDGSRILYRKLRNDSKSAYRRSLLILGVALVNRVISGIDAFRSAGSFNRRKEFSDNGWRVYYSAAGLSEESKIEFGVTRQF